MYQRAPQAYSCSSLLPLDLEDLAGGGGGCSGNRPAPPAPAYPGCPMSGPVDLEDLGNFYNFQGQEQCSAPGDCTFPQQQYQRHAAKIDQLFEHCSQDRWMSCPAAYECPVYQQPLVFPPAEAQYQQTSSSWPAAALPCLSANFYADLEFCEAELDEYLCVSLFFQVVILPIVPAWNSVEFLSRFLGEIWCPPTCIPSLSCMPMLVLKSFCLIVEKGREKVVEKRTMMCWIKLMYYLTGWLIFFIVNNIARGLPYRCDVHCEHKMFLFLSNNEKYKQNIVRALVNHQQLWPILDF